MENTTVVTMKRLLIGSELQQLKITGYMVELSCANLGQQSTRRIFADKARDKCEFPSWLINCFTGKLALEEFKTQRMKILQPFRA